MNTSELRIIPCSIKYNSKLVEGYSAFEKEFGIKVAQGYMEFTGAMDYSLELLKQGQPEEWGAYMIIHTGENSLIGIAGYKGIPHSGKVEIGYSIAPGYRNRGYATEAVKLLIENAFNTKEVNKVIAHTLPEYNASNSVLKKCGLRLVDEIYSEEDGYIWLWELEKNNSGS